MEIDSSGTGSIGERSLTMLMKAVADDGFDDIDPRIFVQTFSLCERSFSISGDDLK